MKKLYRLSYAGIAAALLLASCADEQQFTSPNTDAKRINVQKISDEMAKVRDYVPLYACVAPSGHPKRRRLLGGGHVKWVPTI